MVRAVTHSEVFFILKTMHDITLKLNKQVNSDEETAYTFIQFVYFYWVLMYVLLHLITFDPHRTIVIQEDVLCASMINVQHN